MNAHFIGPDDVDQIPFLFAQNAVQLPTQQEERGLCAKHHKDNTKTYTNGCATVEIYGDPALGLKKNVERVVVQHDDINDRAGIR